MSDEATQDLVSQLPPAGGNWVPEGRGGHFTQLIGPIYISREGLEPGEPARFGFRVRQEHCNPRLVCHGGMLASMLDIALACALRELPGVLGPLPTVSMTLDFLAPAPCGVWIESRVSALRVARTLMFAQALLTAPAGTVLRGSGVYVRKRTHSSP